MIFKSIKTGDIPGGTHRNSWWSWGVPPCSPSPDPISDQKMSLSTPFQNLAVRNYVTITVRRLTLKRFLKTHFEFAYMILTPVVPSKTIPEYRPNRAKVYARFQTKTAKKPYPLGRHILSRRVASSMYVYRQPRALQSTDKIEIFLYVSLICIYKSLIIGTNAFFRCLYL